MRAWLSGAVTVYTVWCCAATVAPAGHVDGWKRYAYPSEGFAIAAPAEPRLSTSHVATARGSFEMRSYTARAGEAAYFVAVCDYGAGSASANAPSLLQGAKNGILQNANSHSIRERSIVLGASPGLEFEAEPNPAPAAETPMRIWARIYVAGPAVYQILATSPAGKPEPGAARFLDSFQWLPRAAD